MNEGLDGGDVGNLLASLEVVQFDEKDEIADLDPVLPAVLDDDVLFQALRDAAGGTAGRQDIIKELNVYLLAGTGFTDFLNLGV